MLSPLKNYRILVVDADLNLAQVLKTMLNDMGFSDVHLTRSGAEAIKLIHTQPFDFIITEWNTEQIDGIGLIEFIRRNPRSPNPTLPIIMLTGRAEQIDVTMARNYGINEYVIKPFTVKSIYSRLERLIEHPRSFVVSKGFVGPDRRVKDKKAETKEERRKRKNLPELKPKEVSKAIVDSSDAPKIWMPDFSLKMKLGKNIHLNDFITEEILVQSQSAINSIMTDSLGWIKDNINDLKRLYSGLSESSAPESVAEISNVLLTINSRAGTFGYTRAAQIVYFLYLFIRNNFNVKDEGHRLVIKKHIEVLQVIFGNQMSGDGGAVGEQIAKELKTLIGKYTNT